MGPLPDDRGLLDGFRRGDPEALARVYEAYAEHVSTIVTHGFAFSSEGKACRFHGYRSRFDLEDAVHEVFLRAFSERARHSYDGLRPFETWLAAITRAVVIDDFRARRRLLLRFSVEEEPHREEAADGGVSADPVDGVVSPTGNPGLDAEGRELTEIIARFRESLSESESEVFRLRFQEGKSLSEVEAETGRSPSKVKTLERALRKRILDLVWRSGYLDDHLTTKKNSGWIARLRGSTEGTTKGGAHE